MSRVVADERPWKRFPDAETRSAGERRVDLASGEPTR